MRPPCRETPPRAGDARRELVHQTHARRRLSDAYSQTDPRGVTLRDFGLLVENFGMVEDE